MKKIVILLSLILIGVFVFAHSEDAELNVEIQKGRELLEKLQKGEITCQNLNDEDFHSIGEYVMEQMVGGGDHILMNQTMERMHGKEAEELMHINMGKRYTGCYGNGPTSTISMMGPITRMPMMNMPMMGYGWWNFPDWRSWGFLGSVFSILGFLWLIVILTVPILVLILLILGIFYLIKKLKSDIRKE